MYNKLVVIVVGLGSILVPLALVYVLFALPTPHAADTYVPATSTVKTIPPTMQATTTTLDRADVILNWFAPLSVLTLGDQKLEASIADTEAEREKGLSDTPYIPSGVVKLFVFETTSPWAFWMKNMLYPIDIIWLDENKTVIYVAANLSPSTYPNTFAPNAPAKYVIETAAGFTDTAHIAVGTKATW
jgi:hypothetical protein